MAGGNPFMPPGANPGGPVPQPGLAGPGGNRMQLLGGNRVPGPGVRGAGASIMAPPPPDQPPSGQPQQPVPPSQQGQPFADVHQEFKQVNNQYKDGMRAQEVLDHLRAELDQLMERGDTVRPEHVIEAAGRLVGHGIGATQLATIMSDMPAQGGEGLASWIRMHDVTITNAEQSLAMENNVLRHGLGVQALRSMAATHLDEKTKQMPGSQQTAGPTSMPSLEPMQGNGLMSGSDMSGDGGMNA